MGKAMYRSQTQEGLCFSLQEGTGLAGWGTKKLARIIVPAGKLSSCGFCCHCSSVTWPTQNALKHLLVDKTNLYQALGSLPSHSNIFV